ncbi:hypothetical protein [Herpetosiphon gulosus]|uniref:Uncharacterized protein n=1 Tax=Herpetosiphon gulosus TaxID=1973496 RepID=A0ABP9WZ10_9CHLR
MALFYKGVGKGTYWFNKNPMQNGGFSAAKSHLAPSSDLVREHIIHGARNSPFISLSRSFAIAWTYALMTQDRPNGQLDPRTKMRDVAYVYVIQLNEPLPTHLSVIDPASYLLQQQGVFASPAYQHNGLMDLLHSVIDPGNFGRFRKRSCPHAVTNNQPDPYFTPSISDDLRAAVMALRDSELLVHGTIDHNNIIDRIDVWNGMHGWSI